jgi:hypothetical protein
LLVPVAGCGAKNPYFEDDEGAPRPTASGGEQPDKLSRPYALGTKVKITVRTASSDPTSGWQVRSDNPAVLSVDKLSISDDKYVTAECTAVGNGDTMIRALDESGNEQRAAQLSVATPDKIRLYAHGLLRVLGQNEAAAAAAEVTAATLLNGGTGVYAVIYYRGSERLYGRGILQFDAVTQLNVTNPTTSGGPTNEWLFIKTLMIGTYNLTFRRGAVQLVVPVFSLPETELRSISLLQEKVDSPAADQQIWVLVEATNRDGQKVQGVHASFTLGGAAQVGSGNNTSVTMGDLYRYNYAAGSFQDLVATRGSMTATLSIPASKGYVADTTYLGCAMTPGRRAQAATATGALWLVAALALLLLRRRARLI